MANELGAPQGGHRGKRHSADPIAKQWADVCALLEAIEKRIPRRSVKRVKAALDDDAPAIRGEEELLEALRSDPSLKSLHDRGDHGLLAKWSPTERLLLAYELASTTGETLYHIAERARNDDSNDDSAAAFDVLTRADVPDWILDNLALLRSILQLVAACIESQDRQLPEYMAVPSSELYHCTREIVARGAFAQNNGERWPTAKIRRDNLTADVQIKPDPKIEPYLMENELIAWQTKVADIALGMDDTTADVLDYVTYEVIRQAQRHDQDVTFSAKRFYELRGIKRHRAGDGHRGGYKTEYRREFAREVEKLGTTWIRVAEMNVIETDEKGKRRRSTKRGIESPAIVVCARAGQLNLGGHVEPDTFMGRLGPLFASAVFGSWRQTALISTKALGYDPYRQLPEKRLTRYLSWQWRIRQGFGNYLQPYKVRTLLEATGMSIDKAHPERTKDRLETALGTLTADGVVSGWQYGAGWDEEIVGKRGWAAKWADWSIEVEPPQAILDHYKTIPLMTPKPANGETIGARLQAALNRLGYTQLQAAEEIGVDQATLSRIIRGKRPGSATHKKVVGWLDMHSQGVDHQA